ncbi:MAG: hypothetical protein U5M51_04225 [Emticicia sp.]|nr:hypothetical protein [Emticicia sp.]
MQKLYCLIIFLIFFLFTSTISKGQTKNLTMLFIPSIEKNRDAHLSYSSKVGIRLYDFENKYKCFLYQGFRVTENLRTITGLKFQSFQYNLPQMAYLTLDIAWDNRENPIKQDAIYSYVLLGMGYNINKESSAEINFGLFNTQSKISLSYSRTFQLKIKYKKEDNL